MATVGTFWWGCDDIRARISDGSRFTRVAVFLNEHQADLEVPIPGDGWDARRSPRPGNEHRIQQRVGFQDGKSRISALLVG